jgi:hypothetical protein
MEKGTFKVLIWATTMLAPKATQKTGDNTGILNVQFSTAVLRRQCLVATGARTGDAVIPR